MKGTIRDVERRERKKAGQAACLYSDATDAPLFPVSKLEGD